MIATGRAPGGVPRPPDYHRATMPGPRRLLALLLVLAAPLLAACGSSSGTSSPSGTASATTTSTTSSTSSGAGVQPKKKPGSKAPGY